MLTSKACLAKTNDHLQASSRIALILSTALENGQAPVPNDITQLIAGPYTALTSSVSLMASNLSLGRIFNSCHIGQAQVFMLPQTD